ncbi:unnamed protein product [Adineta ricciae]|uniref:F-box domain-containing protein n=1 Tax=Adineta ricciae TaxID=249248 RepID=A0A815B6C3_ADIRI|nr:unnamed protein product [Adineta ricciae]CAF1652288.1 unnamed protein product [Adineta ricciae]
MEQQCTLLDQLPTELFYLLFDYFWAHEIFFSFTSLNRRINSIIKSYHAYHLNFESIRKCDFTQICESVRPEQVISLILSDKNDTPNQSTLFLSYFQIEQFTNLRSISLIKIEYKSLHRILLDLSELKQLEAVSFNYSGERGMHIKLEDNIGELPVKICSLSPNFYQEIFPQLKSIGTIYSEELTSIDLPNLLHLKLNSYSLTFDMNEIFKNAPQLQSVTFLFSHFDHFIATQSYNSIKQLNLTSAHISMPICRIEQFLQNFPNLMHFEIRDVNETTDMSILNGYQWQIITQTFKTFNFEFHVKNVLTESDLDSFRTRFWIEEKHWFVVYHDRRLFTVSLNDIGLSASSISSDSFVYLTIPNNSIIYQPNGSSDHQLTSPDKNFRLSSIKNLQLYWKNSFDTLSSIIDLNQIEYLRISHSSYHLLKYIQHHMSKLRTLYLSDNFDKMNSEDSSIHELQLKQICTLKFNSWNFSEQRNITKLSHLFPCVEHLQTWCIKSRSDIIYIIGQFKQLSSITFTIDRKVNSNRLSPEFTSELIVNDIKQHFRCSVTCELEFVLNNCGLPSLIHIWLGKRNIITTNDSQQSRFPYLIWHGIKKLF